MSQTKTQLVASPLNLNGADLTFPSSQGSTNQFLKNGSTAGTLEFGNVNSFLDAQFNEVSPVTLSAASHSVTGLPSTTYYIQIVVRDFATSADTTPVFRIGTGSGFATTNYEGAASYNPSGSASSGPGTQYTKGFGILPSSTDSTGGFSVFAEFMLVSSDFWVYKHMGGYDNNLFMIMGAGQKDLGGTLDRIQLNTTDSNTFSGTMKVRYWSN